MEKGSRKVAGARTSADIGQWGPGPENPGRRGHPGLPKVEERPGKSRQRASAR